MPPEAVSLRKGAGLRASQGLKEQSQASVLLHREVENRRIWSSYKVHMVDALALEVDEGRGKLR